MRLQVLSTTRTQQVPSEKVLLVHSVANVRTCNGQALKAANTANWRRAGGGTKQPRQATWMLRLSLGSFWLARVQTGMTNGNTWLWLLVQPSFLT